MKNVLFTYMAIIATWCILQTPAFAVSVNVGIGEGGTEIEAGAVNPTKDSLVAEVGNLWGVSNSEDRDGILYFTYSDLAGSTLPSTIQPGTYTFTARIGASDVGAGFSGLNDITAGSNTDQGSVAGFFLTLSSDAEAAKNNMVAEFNTQTGVSYTQPSEADPASLTFTTWTFTWTVAPGSPVIGTEPYFGVYTKTGASGGNGFWDDSTLSYTPNIPPTSIPVPIGDSGTQVEAGATNTEKDGLAAEASNLWGVSNTADRDGLWYFTYSDLAGSSLPSTIQAGTYTFSARIGATSTGAGFSGLNDITAGTNTEQGSVAGFFSTLSSDAETAKNNMVTEFNAQGGVFYTPPPEADPENLTFTTWTFSWTIAEGSPVIGTNPYFAVYTKTGASGGTGFWDDSILTYTPSIQPLPAIADFSSDIDTLVSPGTEVTLSWEVSDATELSISPSVGDVLPQTVDGVGQITVTVDVETTFTLTASNGTYTTSTELVVSAPLPTLSFTADDTYVSPGESVALSWQAFDADSVTLLGIGDVNPTGSTTVNPSENTTYTLVATNVFGTIEQEVTVRVGPERLNILLMLVDDYGPMDSSVPFAYDHYDDTGTALTTAFNNYYRTPNMETLAANGMKFTQAYAMPMCSPTRVSLMTGLNSPRHGVTVHLNAYDTIDNKSFGIKTHRGPNNWRYLGMDGTDIALPQLLKDIGYHTFFVGKDHMSDTQEPTAIGFDVSDSALYKSTALTPKATTMIENAVAAGDPFFGYISYQDVHAGFYYASDVTYDYTQATPPAYNANHAKFSTMVESVDNSLGTIVAKLNELGVADDTLIIFLGDNGSDSPALSDEHGANGTNFDDFPMRGKKGSAYEGGIRIPFYVSWGARDDGNSFQQRLPIPAASVEHDIIMVEDVAPTILALLDQPAPSMDGYDLTPYLRADGGTHRPQKVLRHMPHEHRSNYFTAFRDGDWKLIYRYHIDEAAELGETNEDYPNDFPVPFELYNLDDDPYETNNLAAQAPEKLLSMARAMARELDDSWGVYGPLWPALNPTQVSIPARPLVDDPFVIDFSIDGRDAVDSDDDGLADAYEDLDANGLVGMGETDAEDNDSDDDKYLDGDELRTGTDPLSRASFFNLAMQSYSANSLMLTWPSAPGALYRIEESTNLGSWDTLLNNVPASASGSATSQEVDIPEDPEAAARYFLRVQLLPEVAD